MDIAAAIEQGRYISLDVAETLAIFMVNDLPDPVRFFGVAGDLFTTAAQGDCRGEVRLQFAGNAAQSCGHKVTRMRLFRWSNFVTN